MSHQSGARSNSEPHRLLSAVETALDALIAASGPYGGLVPSLLDRADGTMLEPLPDPIPGQRNSDRAPGGSNLMHDEPLLRTMYELSEWGRSAYGAAADRYLDRWVRDCTDTATGLFPWGEHAYWDLTTETVGNGYRIDRPDHDRPTHDHLRAAPQWLLQAIHRRDPAALHNFAGGLRFHWNDPERPEYIRHAYICERDRYPTSDRACDFPRHGGQYIVDWSFAYAAEPHGEYLRQIRKMLDYWWTRRFETDLLPLESRGNNDNPSHGQTVALAASLREAAAMLDGTDCGPDLPATMRERADAYLAAVIDTDHGCATWGSEYGDWPAAYVGLIYTCALRHGGDEALLERAEAIGAAYREQPLPTDETVPAMDAGLALDLIADLADLTGEDRWLTAGTDLADDAIDAYCDRPIPRGATGIDWYESQMGPGFLLHGITHVALRDLLGEACPATADYSPR